MSATSIYKYDRRYTLNVGDYSNGQGIQLKSTDTERPLQITFDISRSADIKHKGQNTASIEIYNLTPEQERLIDSRFLEASFYVGYDNEEGEKLLVKGNVTESSTIKRGTDSITQIIIGEGYTALTQARLKANLSPGQPVEDVIRTISESMPDVARGPIIGTNLNSPIVHGWRLSGTPKQELDKITSAYGLEYNVTAGVLTVTDVNGPTSKSVVTVPVINQDTGLIEVPFRTTEIKKLPKGDKRTRYGVQFKVLLDAAISPSSVVKLESQNISGYFRVNSIRYTGDFRGTSWYSECQCSEMTDSDVIVVI
jgi:hypothetical protein